MTGGVTASYVFDGGGARVTETIAGATRVFVGNFYERQYYLEDCSDGLAQKWTAATGTWAVTGSGYRQSATTSNTNAYRSWAQGSAFNYEWKATYTSGTSAGFYLFASASTGAERGNSYRIWQDATTVKLYESANNVATQRASWAAANAAGQTHTYQVSYDPLTGSFSVKRDGATLGSWTDTTPLQNGNYVALRTDAANVLFDDIKITRESKYYYAGSQRVAVRHNGSAQVNYLLGDHLGSTALTTNQAGARLTELRYYPWGDARYNGGSQVTKYRFTGQAWDGGTGLYFYGARWYDPAIGRFLQADTIVPQPGDPQSLNRYAYTLNNPLRYRDPTGHDIQDFLYTFGEVTGGLVAQVAYVNTLQAISALAAQPNESDAATFGRHLGNIVALAQGAGEMVSGAGLIGGGVAACGTGVLCPVGAPAIVAGGAVAAHGVGVVGIAAAQEGPMLGSLLAQAKSAGRSSTQGHHPWPKYLGGPKKQPLLDLPTKLHEQYHAGLDTIFSRFKGSMQWDDLSLTQQQDVLTKLRDFSRKFDVQNNTQTLEALEKSLKETGVLP